MANIQISSPFLRGFTHTAVTIGTSYAVALDAAVTPERRMRVILQNQHASAIVSVRFAATGTVGLNVKPGESISLDNYNGIVRCVSDTAATTVHIAYAVV